jgi:hypothetical protein
VAFGHTNKLKTNKNEIKNLRLCFFNKYIKIVCVCAEKGNIWLNYYYFYINERWFYKIIYNYDCTVNNVLNKPECWAFSNFFSFIHSPPHPFLGIKNCLDTTTQNTFIVLRKWKKRNNKTKNSKLVSIIKVGWKIEKIWYCVFLKEIKFKRNVLFQ